MAEWTKTAELQMGIEWLVKRYDMFECLFQVWFDILICCFLSSFLFLGKWSDCWDFDHLFMIVIFFLFLSFCLLWPRMRMVQQLKETFLNGGRELNFEESSFIHFFHQFLSFFDLFCDCILLCIIFFLEESDHSCFFPNFQVFVSFYVWLIFSFCSFWILIVKSCFIFQVFLSIHWLRFWRCFHWDRFLLNSYFIFEVSFIPFLFLPFSSNWFLEMILWTELWTDEFLFVLYEIFLKHWILH